MPKRWNTMRLALYGALAGFLYAVFTSGPYWKGDTGLALEGVGTLFGGAVGGAIVVATVSGLRNLFVR